MSRDPVNYSSEKFPVNRLPVGIDFSKTNVINLKENVGKNAEDFDQEIRAELVSFNRVDKSIKPYRSKISLGSYISKENLQKILKKEQKDRSYFGMLDYVRKNDRTTIAIREDFDLLRDFFPSDLVREVEDFCYRIIPKVEMIVIEGGDKKLTPRKRRGYILAVFKSVCRRNGRKFTEELLEEINNRFQYERRIKIFEVCKAENDLIGWNLIAKKPEKAENDLRIFYLNVINNLNRLKNDPIITANEENKEIISLTQKFITKFTIVKDKKKELIKLIKHQDIDFASRLIIWVIARYFAQKKFDLNFRSPEEVPGWTTLFLVETPDLMDESEQLTIRSMKYIFWASFSLRKKLKESKLYPKDE